MSGIKKGRNEQEFKKWARSSRKTPPEPVLDFGPGRGSAKGTMADFFCSQTSLKIQSLYFYFLSFSFLFFSILFFFFFCSPTFFLNSVLVLLFHSLCLFYFHFFLFLFFFLYSDIFQNSVLVLFFFFLSFFFFFFFFGYCFHFIFYIYLFRYEVQLSSKFITFFTHWIFSFFCFSWVFTNCSIQSVGVSMHFFNPIEVILLVNSCRIKPLPPFSLGIYILLVYAYCDRWLVS